MGEGAAGLGARGVRPAVGSPLCWFVIAMAGEDHSPCSVESDYAPSPPGPSAQDKLGDQ